MHFMNEAEIDEYARRHAGHPLLGPATKFLADFRDVVNANSDGWAYWAPPLRAADKLMTLIEKPQTADEAALGLALRPIKSFCTRHKLKCPELGPERFLQWTCEECGAKPAYGLLNGYHFGDVLLEDCMFQCRQRPDGSWDVRIDEAAAAYFQQLNGPMWLAKAAEACRENDVWTCPECRVADIGAPLEPA